jgi:type I site-specific restriction-modification system R (restriction) subunit
MWNEPESDNAGSYPTLTDRDNVVVLCDEAHRSQYGLKARIKIKGETTTLEYGYAKYLRDAVPNATFVAFTGTPIAAKDKDTRGVFGDYVDIYDIEQAVKDDATVSIYYESRLVKLELDSAVGQTIDSEIDELTEDDGLRLKSTGVGRIDHIECPTCHRDLDPSTFSLSKQSAEEIEAHIEHFTYRCIWYPQCGTRPERCLERWLE